MGEAAPTVGLSGREAEARRRRGEGNVSVTGTSRTYTRILRTNVFSPYNTILFVIGGALLAMGRINDAVISVGIGVLNAAISAVQEIRAKRQLDHLQLLARGTVVVLRDGRDAEVVPEAVVRGDVVRVRPGDQVVVDGPVVERSVGGGRVAADRGVRRAAAGGGRGPAVGQLLHRRRRPAAGPGRRRGQLRQPVDRRGPP